MDKFRLSAVVMVGPLRKHAQDVVNKLCVQSAIDFMEIVIVDFASHLFAPLIVQEKVKKTYLRCDPTESFGIARMKAVQSSNSEMVAFIEDHCVPEKHWAAALILNTHSDLIHTYRSNFPEKK